MSNDSVNMRRRVSFSLGFYLAKRFLASIVSAVFALTLLIAMLDFVELSRKLSGRDGIESDITLQLLLLKLPDLILQMLPFAVLIGTLMCLTKLTRDHELIAIRASGIPARSFLKPLIYTCLFIGVFALTVINPFAATTLKSYQKIEHEVFPGKTRGFLTEGGEIWLKQTEEDRDLIIFSNSVLDDGRRLEDATIFVNNKDGAFIERIDAENLRLRDGKWLLDMPVILKPGKETVRESSMDLPTTLTPETIRNSFTSPQTLSIWELWNFVTLLKQTGFPTLEHEMHLQKTLALPAFILAMFLLAAPFSLQFSRNQSLMRIIFIGVAFGFGFYLFTNFIGTYGMAGRINVIFAAWLPTLIAGFISLYLFLHFREE